MSYKIGDKFIVEIDRIYSSKKHEESRYGVKGFSCLVFDRKSLDRALKHGCFTMADEALKTEFWRGFSQGYTEGIDAGYYEGLQKAWDLVRKIESWPEDGGMTNEQLIAIFGENWLAKDLYRNLSPRQALDKVEAWEKQQEEEENTMCEIADAFAAWLRQRREKL